MKKIIQIALILTAILTASDAHAQWLLWPRYVAPSQCANGQCSQSIKPARERRTTQKDAKNEQPSETQKDQEPTKEETTVPTQPKEVQPKEDQPKAELLSVNRARFAAPSLEIADACDQILDRLEARYGKPKVWKPFPVYFRKYTGNGIAGYTQYAGGGVVEVVVYESLDNAVGGTLDHELTHAFFFYLLQSNFDLFLNEGLAQNSEYRRRETLRQTVYRRYSNGEFVPINQLYGRNNYDGSLLIYHEGFSVVDFLIARGGSLWMAAFMDALVKSNDVNSTLARFYGYKSLSELQTAWTEYIEGGQNRLKVGAVR